VRQKLLNASPWKSSYVTTTLHVNISTSTERTELSFGLTPATVLFYRKDNIFYFFLNILPSFICSWLATINLWKFSILDTFFSTLNIWQI